jgi:hypothetical protein
VQRKEGSLKLIIIRFMPIRTTFGVVKNCSYRKKKDPIIHGVKKEGSGFY